MKTEIDKDAYDFGDRLRSLRLKRGFLQKELAARLDVSIQTISGYEHNSATPTLDNAIELARILNTSLDYLMGIDNNPTVRLYNLSEAKEKVIYDFIKAFIDESDR